ncbi:NeuD/PglB/VioB family sugar acetyltransferase [Dyadobacter tibetensis]|uniref:NeuD/PglB/VioB family sugar acetyltransferase n=1 Tax=Dyadobacter tibetensis TaxID=1211851 RepID=UPI0004712C5C|nr:NeuD/PglB/VioB family sugar acetyltransferase [Dyadobacter tibetensis]
MLIYGSGGHAKVLISSLQALNMNVSGVFDDDPHVVPQQNIPFLGSYHPGIFPTRLVILGMGDIGTRLRLAAGIRHAYGQIVHPSALVDVSVPLGLGSVILQGAIVQVGSIIGPQVIINTRASVDHDCRIGAFVHIAPGAIICGGVSVGANTLVGAGSILVPGIRIGENCFIAAGSVITQDFPDGCFIRGNPAKRIGTYQHAI